MSNDQKRRVGLSNTWIRQQPKSTRWIWEGVVAEGAVTLLSAPEKTGKTTLLSLLLDRRRAGGELLGRAVFPGKTVLATEESGHFWSLRQPPLDFGDGLTYYRPAAPTRRAWRRFIEGVLELLQDEPLRLLVIDTATRLMPMGYRNARHQRWALEELSLVAGESGVLIVNQSRNVHRPLAAFADIVIEMGIPRSRTLFSASGRDAQGNASRRRIFTGVGRDPATLQAAVAELNAEGTDYVLVDASGAPPKTLLATLRALLAASPVAPTRQELLARWPGDLPRADSLWRTLHGGLEAGLFSASGEGTKNDPYRFALALTAPAAP